MKTFLTVFILLQSIINAQAKHTLTVNNLWGMKRFQLFTSLQGLGVDSKLLLFPDEYYFVVKPQDARFRRDSIFNWFKKVS